MMHKLGIEAVFSVMKTHPYKAQLGIATTNGFVADIIVQKYGEGRASIDWKRNAAFTFFGFTWFGNASWLIYFKLYNKLFPALANFGQLTLREKLKNTVGLAQLAQGMVLDLTFISPLSLGLSKKIHWEKARGSKEENEAYCSKEENVILKIGFDSELRVISILKDWQKSVVDLVSEEPDDRSINWYYDYKGGIGKSALVKLLCYKYGAIVCSGKASDMKYMIVKYKEKNGVYPNVVIFDIPRSLKDYVSYSGIEEIKNGCFASSKYECDMVLMNSPHILCFANEIPEFEKLSKDRWKVVDLNPVCDFEE